MHLSLYSCDSPAAEKNVKEYLNSNVKRERADTPSLNGLKISL
jgi:hypothetical protein